MNVLILIVIMGQSMADHYYIWQASGRTVVVGARVVNGAEKKII